MKKIFIILITFCSLTNISLASTNGLKIKTNNGAYVSYIELDFGIISDNSSSSKTVTLCNINPDYDISVKNLVNYSFSGTGFQDNLNSQNSFLMKSGDEIPLIIKYISNFDKNNKKDKNFIVSYSDSFNNRISIRIKAQIKANTPQENGLKIESNTGDSYEIINLGEIQAGNKVTKCVKMINTNIYKDIKVELGNINLNNFGISTSPDNPFLIEPDSKKDLCIDYIPKLSNPDKIQLVFTDNFNNQIEIILNAIIRKIIDNSAINAQKSNKSNLLIITFIIISIIISVFFINRFISKKKENKFKILDNSNDNIIDDTVKDDFNYDIDINYDNNDNIIDNTDNGNMNYDKEQFLDYLNNGTMPDDKVSIVNKLKSKLIILIKRWKLRIKSSDSSSEDDKKVDDQSDEQIKKIKDQLNIAESKLKIIEQIKQILQTDSSDSESIILELKIIKQGHDKWKNFFNELNEKIDLKDEKSIKINKINSVDDILLLLNQYKKSKDDKYDNPQDSNKKYVTKNDLIKIKNTIEKKKQDHFIKTFEKTFHFLGFNIKDIINIKESSESTKKNLDKSIEYLHQNEAFLPYFIIGIEKMLQSLNNNIDLIIKNMKEESNFETLFKKVSEGATGNAGIKESIKVIGYKNNRKKLFEIFNIEKYQKFIAINQKDFYSKYLSIYFIPVLNDICKIYLFNNFSYKELRFREEFKSDNIDDNLIDEMFYTIKSTLKSLFDIEIIMVDICKENYDNEKHDKIIYPSDSPKYYHQFNELKEKLPSGMIYDIYSIGLLSNELNLNIKPKVHIK